MGINSRTLEFSRNYLILDFLEKKTILMDTN